MSEYQTYLQDCNCKEKGVLLHNGEICCRWCRTPYGKGGIMNYLEDHFPSKTSVKDYEIVSLIGKESNQIYYSQSDGKMWLNSNKNGFAHDFDKNGLEGTGCKIHSVKRLSDGETFCIGDEITYTPVGKIKWIIGDFFFTSKNDLMVRSKDWSNVEVFDDKIEKVKEPLFTTSDNVAIYEDGDVWVVSNSFDIHCVCACKSWYEKTKQHFKAYFSTEQAARSYCELNKPLLSLLEVHEALYIRPTFNLDVAYVTLKELAKSKIQ